MAKTKRRFQALTDRQMLELLQTAGDQLPREAVDECLRRGPRMLPFLRDVVADKTSWTRPLPEWWAPVHATYILGAMEDPATLVPLLTALRWADAFDCDWVTEDLPSMLGKLGPRAFEPLGAVLRDVTAGWGARAIALSGMAAVTLSAPYLRPGLVKEAAELVANGQEEYYLRQAAANVLLDFRAAEYRELLVAFGREEAAQRADDPEYQGAFYDWEVDEILEGREGGTDSLEYYRRDWLAFYEPDEIHHRQERWAREEEEEAAEQAPEAAATPLRDINAPCPCGSGRPFQACCYLKVH
jgi:hypothetical protein